MILGRVALACTQTRIYKTIYYAVHIRSAYVVMAATAPACPFHSLTWSALLHPCQTQCACTETCLLYMHRNMLAGKNQEHNTYVVVAAAVPASPSTVARDLPCPDRQTMTACWLGHCRSDDSHANATRRDCKAQHGTAGQHWQCCMRQEHTHACRMGPKPGHA